MLDEQKDEGKQEIQIINQVSSKAKSTQRHSSQFFQSYLRSVNISDAHSLDSMRDAFLKKLQKEHQGLMNPYNQPSLKLALLDHTPNMEYMLIQVIYSHFTFQISVLNINEQSETSKIGEFYQGGFSTVYHSNFFKYDLAIKSNKITEEHFEKIFFDTLKEYVIFKVLELFQGGPLMTNAFGFQVLVYADCVQFSMEFCSHQLRCREEVRRDLAESLLRMHLLHVVHFDIKPDNICFSHAFGRYVFIDLGLHRVVEEQIGEKTLTEFRGSMLYCSKELADCCLNGQQHVDLYHNDAECLTKTLDIVKEQQMQRIQSVTECFNLMQSSTFLKINIKYLGIYINFKFEPRDQQVWKRFFRHLGRLQEQSVMEIAYFLEMLTHTDMLNRLIRKLSQYIPLLKTGFLKQKILNHDLQTQKDPFIQPLFKERFIKIISNKSGRVDQEVVHKDSILILKNQNDAVKIGKQTYYFLFTRCVQVNHIGIGLEDARKICEVFTAVEVKRKQQSSEGHQGRLKQCFLFVLEWALRQPAATAQTYAILEQTVPSVVLLEAVEESVLAGMLLKLADLPAPPLLRVRLCLLVLSSLEWVHQKHASKYSYFRLMNAVCPHIQQTAQNIKKQPLTKQENTFVEYLQLSTTVSKNYEKPIKIFLILVSFTSLNFYELVNLKKQKDVIRRQFILYWLYYLDKQQFNTKLFGFLFDRIANQIIKREIAIFKKINYYYIMHINRYSSCAIAQTIAPLHQLAHFSFYRQLTIIEEMILAGDEEAGHEGIARLAKRYEQLAKILRPEMINFMEFFITSFRRQYDYFRTITPFSLNIDYDLILSHFLEIDSYQYYHEHDVVDYMYFLNNMVGQLGGLLKRSNVQEDLRNSYYAKAIAFITRLNCSYCKYTALIGHNKALHRFISPDQRHILQEQILNFIVSLIRLDYWKMNYSIYEMIKDCISFQNDHNEYPTKYNYLALLYEFSTIIQSLIPSFLLNIPNRDFSIQLKFLMYIWKSRTSLGEQDAYFRIILILCNYFESFSYQEVINTFAFIFSMFLQLIDDYDYFFSENQNFILKESRKNKQNRYLTLYAALLMHPAYIKSATIFPRYFYIIWSKFHQLETYCKTIVNSYIYWGCEAHIFKIQNAKQRRINHFYKKEQKVSRLNSIEFIRSVGHHLTNRWMRNIVRNLRKKIHTQPFNASKYELFLKNVQRYAFCHK